MLRNFLLFGVLAALAWGCESRAEAPASSETPPTFSEYWYQGEAEITSYTLKQARYGEVHDGDAVLVFVTEPFSLSHQVKLDYPERAGDDAVSVLKLNLTKKFNTGIYPYSIMQSTFTPVEAEKHPETLKVSTSVQEWCGHVFTQLNREEDGHYHLSSKSYFESEGDVETELAKALLEDDVWARLRLNPESLPQGSFEMIPGTQFSRLRHLPLQPVAAQGALSDKGGELRTYTLTYPELNRTLRISFTSAFPHTIEQWEETMPSGFGPGAKLLTTTAQRKARMMTPYWNQHRPEDTHLREELGLE